MRIALINPPWTDSDDPMLWGVRAGSRWPHFQRRTTTGGLPRYIPFPFFMAIAANTLKLDGHDVLLIDAVAEDVSAQEAITRITDFNPECVFAEMSTPSLHNDLTFLEGLHNTLNDGTYFVGSGTLDVTLAIAIVHEKDVLDFWLQGEYELTLVELVNDLNDRSKWSEINGLIDTDGTSNSPETIADLDKLPPPLYEQLPRMNYGDPVCGLPAPNLQSWLSRGCPFSCSFCVWPQVVYHNNHYRTRDVGTTLDEIKTLIDTCGYESFYFDDDTTNIGEKRMLKLADGIRERGLDAYPWSMMARADWMSRTMLDALADAGMYSVKYGVESIAVKLTNACGKGTKIEKMIDAINYSKERGIKVHLTFTFGLPGETVETIRETMDFAIKTAPETAQFSFCTPFPGTRFFQDCVENNWLTDNDWQRFLGDSHAVISTPELSAQTLEAEYLNALNRWHVFCDKRLDARVDALNAALLKHVESGKTWSLMGDNDYAARVLCNATADVHAARCDAGDIDVIISKHDEEKIWQQLYRSSPDRADAAVRLYN